MFKFGKSKDKEKDSKDAGKDKKSSKKDEVEKMEKLSVDEEETLASASGKLLVTVVEARGLNSSANAFCILSFERNQVLTKPASGSTPRWNHNLQFDVTVKQREFLLEMYSRGQTTDFLGLTRIALNYNEKGSMSDAWHSLRSRENNAESGIEVHITTHYKPADQAQALSINDFELLKVIGKGSFGKVMQVQKKDTKRIYAMKILKKTHLVERDEVGHTKSERIILAKNASPFLVGLKFSFQTPEKIYLVLDYINGGELFFHLQNEGKFSEVRSKFYAAQLLSALESLHEINVIYRDLKPENILVDFDGYIALTDFGLCKEDVKPGEKTNTFCGTPEYMAPEVLQQKGYDPAVDWWTLGILLYEMLTGLPPFYDENTNQMYHKILFGDLVFTDEVSPKARNLIVGLLERDPTKRLGSGANGAKDIKNHPFFSDINWSDLENKRVNAPWKPQLESHLDTSNFDVEFTGMTPQDSVVPDSHLSSTIQNQFKGFTYVDSNEFLG